MPTNRPLALVTGASSGIGAALAGRLAGAGHDLVVVARRSARLEELASRLHEEAGAAVEVVVADLTEPQDLGRVEERVATAERLDLLVNNAGFPGYGPFAECDIDVVDRLLGVHVERPLGSPARPCRG